MIPYRAPVPVRARLRIPAMRLRANGQVLRALGVVALVAVAALAVAALAGGLAALAMEVL